MKIGIVNDSPMATEILRRIVTENKKHHILWVAENGQEAIVNCKRSLPDLILMDIMMPVMNGIEATRNIMRETPCAILVVTATVTGHSSEVFEAMGAGALDAVATPVLGTSGSLTAGMELVRKIDMIGKLIGCTGEQNRDEQLKNNKTKHTYKNRHLVLIGCSTGGPQALLDILSQLPLGINTAIIVIQHMDRQFTSGLATWLNNQIALPVRIIKEGDRPLLGTVLIPDTDHHLIMTSSSTLSYSSTQKKSFYHPSVDVFFASAAHSWYGRIIGVLLTGMGKDGAQGMLAIKEKGWPTLAQDQETSIVFGMPKAAINIGAATEILPLPQIGSRIVELVTQE